MQFEGQHIFENSLLTGVNLFLGAGFSVLSKNKTNNSLPIGNELGEELKIKFKISGNYSLSQISTILENTKRSEFYSYLKERFSIGSFDKKYKVLDRFEIKSIYTTNIDDLVFKIFEKSSTKYLNDLSHKGTVLKGAFQIVAGKS